MAGGILLYGWTIFYEWTIFYGCSFSTDGILI